jgi:hypothetical protein
VTAFQDDATITAGGGVEYDDEDAHPYPPGVARRRRTKTSPIEEEPKP